MRQTAETVVRAKYAYFIKSHSTWGIYSSHSNHQIGHISRHQPTGRYMLELSTMVSIEIVRDIKQFMEDNLDDSTQDKN